MKRILSVLIVLVALLSCVSCGSSFEKAYEAAALEFNTNGLKITLTEAFTENRTSGYTATYEAIEVMLYAQREDFSKIRGGSDITLEEYAMSIQESNSDKEPSLYKKDGILCLEHEYIDRTAKVIYKYFTVVLEGSEGFWMLQFMCDETIYDEYKPYFFEWAKSADVSAE